MLTISEKSVIKLHPLERQVLEKLLALNKEGFAADDLKIFETQLRQALILSREMTGHGFYTRFFVPENVTRLPNRRSFWFGKVSADIPGLGHGAGFQLHIKDGAVNELEGFSFDGPWPDPWPGRYDESQMYQIL